MLLLEFLQMTDIDSMSADLIKKKEDDERFVSITYQEKYSPRYSCVCRFSTILEDGK